MAGGGKAGHVGADLGDNDLGGQVADAWDAAQQPDGVTERVEFAIHLRVDLGDGFVKHIDLTQMQPQQETMRPGDAPLQRGVQLLGRRLDAALHQGEQICTSSPAQRG